MLMLPNPEPMSKLQIQGRAFNVWLEYVWEVTPEYIMKHGINFDEMYEAVIYPKHDILFVKDEDLGVDDEGNAILGQFLPKEMTALVTKRLFTDNDPRRVFTEWHEVAGHGVLQGKSLRKSISRNAKLLTTEKSLLIENTFEWQANTFAANLAAPLNLVSVIFKKLFQTNRRMRYNGPGIYFLNHQRTYVSSHQELARKIAKKIQYYFGGLSVESLSYQVLEIVIDSRGYENKCARRCDFTSTIGDEIHELYY